MSKKKDPKYLSGLRSYLTFCRSYRWRILLVMSIFTFSDILLAVIPIFIGLLVGSLTNLDANRDIIWWYVGGLIFCSSGHDLIWRLGEFSYRGLINEIGFKYEMSLFREVTYKPYPFFVDKLTGKIGSYITMLSHELRDLISSACFNYTSQVVGVVSTLIILGSLNWQSGVIFFVGLIGMILLGRYTLKLNMKRESEYTDIESTKNGLVFDSIANFASIKAFKTELYESRIVGHRQMGTYQASQRAFMSGIIFWASMSIFVRHFIWASLVLINVNFFLAHQLTLGQLATMLSTTLIFSSTIWQAIWSVSQFGLKMARIDEAFSYLDVDMNEKLEDNKLSEPILLVKGIDFQNLSFAYPDAPDTQVLNNISFGVGRGEKVGIVGHTGGGKSTITKLLLDFYDIEPGSILVDNNSVTTHDLANLVSYVPQDTTLFHRTIAENIAYGADDSVDENAIEKAAKLANADEFIIKLKKGYKTMVGERGVKLSGGQRQRIAIARAILQNKPILVLDEATSALDSESEKHIQEALSNLWQDKTVIAVAHRLSTLRHMDKIVVIDHGSIKEIGSHNELLEKDGIYANLWKHQSGGFLEE